MPTKTFESQREYLVQTLVAEGIIHSSDVERAMKHVPREMFLPETVKMNAYLDSPLPIGLGQTISAPHMVAMMTEALELRGGNHILDVGSGSGYQAAILAEVVAPKNGEKKGHVYTIE
ncbi:protein-L-isoaspartate O-methyltransferase, partial [Candidatus Bathyarchaeota archaeon]|nr:protein-L-isoaspartate O-methyltransferase [Candidatus Bathyarchaeota archaeon]